MARMLSEAEKWNVANNCVHRNLKRIVRKVTQQFELALTEKDLHISQFTLLITSSLMGKVAHTKLAEKLALDRTTLTRNLKPLEQRGLIHTSTSELDSRMRLVEITVAGEEMLFEVYPIWQKTQEEVTQHFTTETYSQFLNQLKQFQTKI